MTTSCQPSPEPHASGTAASTARKGTPTNRPTSTRSVVLAPSGSISGGAVPRGGVGLGCGGGVPRRGGVGLGVACGGAVPGLGGGVADCARAVAWGGDVDIEDADGGDAVLGAAPGAACRVSRRTLRPRGVGEVAVIALHPSHMLCGVSPPLPRCSLRHRNLRRRRLYKGCAEISPSCWWSPT